MTKMEIEQCRQKLLALRSELQELEVPSGEGTPTEELGQTGSGNRSRRDAMQAHLAADEGPRLRKRQLQKIDGALRRIEMGDFGRCFVCEEELDAVQLSGDPTITRCINCVDT